MSGTRSRPTRPASVTIVIADPDDLSLPGYLQNPSRPAPILMPCS